MITKILEKNKNLYDLFTSREEYNTPILDKYGRFPYYLSKNRDILNPSISKILIKNGLKIEYPENKKFAVCLTHDIDNVHFLRFSKLAKLLLNLNISDSLRMLLSRINKRFNPYWNFKDIISLEEKYEAKSTFYFMAITKYFRNFNYNINELEHELNYISDKDWEVGLHGSYEAYNDLDEIQAEKRRLEKCLGKRIIGYRNHCLRFKVPDTWTVLKKAGFKYDTSFGYADMIGFRNGMCHPFKPFNLNTKKDIDILEIPLIISDFTLFKYMHLNLKSAWKVTKLVIDTTKKYNGVVTILWHNIYITNENLKLYEKILKYCHDENAWMTNGENIWKFWTKL